MIYIFKKIEVEEQSKSADPKWRQVERHYHVPEVVGQPVDQGADAADELQVLGLGGALPDEVEDEAGRDEGHGEDDTDGHGRIHRRAQPSEGEQGGEEMEDKIR